MSVETFKALLASVNEEGKVVLQYQDMHRKDLPAGEVLIKVHYSSVNYKDGLAATNARSGVTKNYPLILGIDASGEVVESASDRFQPGDKVIAHNYGMGVQQDGGYSEYLSVPAEWLVPLPGGLTLREAMVLGTAGFTAAQSIQALEGYGLDVKGKPILVRGATGGVGGTSVLMLSQLGYQVIAESRKKEEQLAYLTQLGATEVVLPEEAQLEKSRPLSHQKWQGIIDPVGGDKLADYFAQVEMGGSVALSGNAGGVKFEATVLPFILRGVNLLGINSVDMPHEQRIGLWNRMAADLKPKQLEELIDYEVSLEELPNVFPQIVGGKMKGRILVNVQADNQ